MAIHRGRSLTAALAQRPHRCCCCCCCWSLWLVLRGKCGLAHACMHGCMASAGVQYREIETGSGGVAAELGSICEISYVVYRLSSGAYFKYSSGGTPVFLFSLGYGQEGKRDVGETYRFTLGEAKSLPAAATPAVVGMRQGGRRRVLVPPRFGWVDDTVRCAAKNSGSCRCSERVDPWRAG